MAEREPERVLDRLRQGNDRFQEVMRADEPRRAELARGQRPHTVVLACADSRVAPEILFDAGLGELFVVRLAGNVADTESIASIEFVVANLGVRLIVVLAHESCGAVEAAIEGRDLGENLNQLVSHITPALQESGTSDADAVARRSARLNAERLTAESEILRDVAERGDLRIVTAFLHFTTGEVEFEGSLT